MPSITELREKAAKMADAGTSKIANTRDRMQSQPSKNIDWDAEIKPKPPPPPKPPRPPPPPSRTSSTSSSATTSQPKDKPPVPVRKADSSTTPILSRSASQAIHSSSASPLPSMGRPPVIRRETRPDATPLPPPPSRTSSNSISLPKATAQPHATKEADIDRIDWTNLSLEDKQVFFSWLDEFFARYLQVATPARSSTTKIAAHVQVPLGGRTPPLLTETVIHS